MNFVGCFPPKAMTLLGRFWGPLVSSGSLSPSSDHELHTVVPSRVGGCKATASLSFSKAARAEIWRRLWKHEISGMPSFRLMHRCLFLPVLCMPDGERDGLDDLQWLDISITEPRLRMPDRESSFLWMIPRQP